VRVHQPPATIFLSLGATTYDLTSRALVMGILNRTRDSCFEPAATYDLDALFERADRLVDEGADLLDIGGVKAGPGDDVDEGEELERVVPVVTELVKRFDVPISIDTWRASVAQAAFAEGACLGNDISGFADDEYLPVAASAGAAVVATHIRLQPRVADPTPHYDDVTETVAAFLTERRQRALNAGVREDRIVVDAGLDLGKTAAQSLQLLRDSERLAGLGAPLLLSASNKTFLGVMFDLPVSDRREPSLAATALGIAAGCRIVRVHDVQGTVRVRDVIARLLEEGRA
jgi:dihydropteroate synthase